MRRQMDLRKRLYVKNYEDWAACAQWKCFSSEELKVQEVPGGLILPVRRIPDPCMAPKYEGGVMDAQGQFVAGSIRVTKRYPGYIAVVRGYEVKEEVIQSSSEEVIFGGVVLDHFGHFLVESMSRLWYVLENRGQGKKIVFISNGKPGQWMDRFLELLGIEKERYSILRSPVRFASVTVPEESVHSWGHFYTKEYLQIYARLRDRVEPSAHKKLYLTHSAYGGIVCCNEKYFENYFAAKGFLVVSPEKYSLQEQIAFLKGADEVACMVSTLSHLVLFAKPRTKLIMLTRTNDEVLVAQCLVNEAAQADWYLIDTSQNFLYGDRTNGVILLGTTPYWRQFVREHYGEDVVEETLPQEAFAYMQEWCKYFGKGDNLRRLDEEDFVSLFRQMYEVVLGKECPAGMLEKSPKEEHIEELEYKLGSETNYNVALNDLVGKPVLVVYEITTDRYRTLRFYNGQVCGDGTAPIRDIRISFTDDRAACTYKLYTKEQGWSPQRKSGEEAEAPGGQIYGLSIELVPSCTQEFELSFRLHIRDGWSPWLGSGQSASQEDSPLDAIQLVLKQKAAK